MFTWFCQVLAVRDHLPSVRALGTSHAITTPHLLFHTTFTLPSTLFTQLHFTLCTCSNSTGSSAAFYQFQSARKLTMKLKSCHSTTTHNSTWTFNSFYWTFGLASLLLVHIESGLMLNVQEEEKCLCWLLNAFARPWFVITNPDTWTLGQRQCTWDHCYLMRAKPDKLQGSKVQSNGINQLIACY